MGIREHGNRDWNSKSAPAQHRLRQTLIVAPRNAFVKRNIERGVAATAKRASGA
jgi:hypothetical protein